MELLDLDWDVMPPFYDGIDNTDLMEAMGMDHHLLAPRKAARTETTTNFNDAVEDSMLGRDML